MSMTRPLHAWVCAGLGCAGVVMASDPDEVSLPAAEPSAWHEMIQLKGDFRYRMEWTDRDDQDQPRRRDRVRIRIGLEADLRDGLRAHVQLASGRDDPVSSNQTLGESFSGKPARLDLAYLSWKPGRIGLDVQAGKVPLPFLCLSDLIWDPAVNPEGIGASWQTETDAALWLARAGHWWVTESPSDPDTFLYSLQAAAQWKSGSNVRVLTGASLYLYDRLKGRPMLYGGQPFGNTAMDMNAEREGQDGYEPMLVFAEDYHLGEGFLQVDWDAWVPVSLYAHAVFNFAADSENVGWLAGMTLGRARVVHSAEFGFNYRSVEKDAAVGAYTDANSGGGGTDVDGFRFFARYQVTRSMQAGASWYVQQLDPDGQKLDYNRVQIEATARF